MSDEPTAMSCDQAQQHLTEMALGVLTGRDRSLVLDHVAGCPRCDAELKALSTAADSLLELAPEREPSVGFELRLFERVGVDLPHEPQRKGFGLRRLPAAWLAAAAVLLVALAFGAGWFSAPAPSGHLATQRGADLASAPLRAHGQGEGQVTLYKGRPSWMFMEVSDAGSTARVTCEITTTNGAKVRVGTFWLSAGGYGAWGATLPIPADLVRSAEVVGPGGNVLATASFTV